MSYGIEYVMMRTTIRPMVILKFSKRYLRPVPYRQAASRALMMKIKKMIVNNQMNKIMNKFKLTKIRINQIIAIHSKIRMNQCQQKNQIKRKTN